MIELVYKFDEKSFKGESTAKVLFLMCFFVIFIYINGYQPRSHNPHSRIRVWGKNSMIVKINGEILTNLKSQNINYSYIEHFNKKQQPDHEMIYSNQKA